jgi:NAD(P)-dependent dehydrogenase (short-subunit alcohol dehydrogenase family)
MTYLLAEISVERALVTGVSAGLGVETARALAAHGVRVVGAARDLAKAERATALRRCGNLDLGGGRGLCRRGWWALLRELPRDEESARGRC